MKFVSTRGKAPAVPIGAAIAAGAAPDGGLYVPATALRADVATLSSLESLPALGATLLAPFFAGDTLISDLPALCRDAFAVPAPLVTPDPARPGFYALELFHGPTGAFKDFGARFLAGAFDRLGDPARPLTVLVATSGDTGGAVGSAAEGRDAMRAFILYPKGRVSTFQEHQLCCWRSPVTALEVEGDFDACQGLVKAAFADRALYDAQRLTSANSINIARLLPQMVYLTAAALRLKGDSGVEPGLILPTGNLGHAVAALYARNMGVPIGPIVLATNANRTLADWKRDGDYRPRPSVQTLANAMDVGAPSNFERLIQLSASARRVRVELVNDDAIRSRIRTEYSAAGYVWCPHSATAAEAYARLDPAQKAERPWIVAATAHPYKFADVVEPLIGETLEAPPALAAILDRPAEAVRIAPRLEALAEVLRASERRPAEVVAP